jgi:hypothetical protein
LASSRTRRPLPVIGHGSNYPSPVKEREIQPEEMTVLRFLGVVSSESEDVAGGASVYVRPLFRWDGKWLPVHLHTEEALPRWRDAPEDVRAGTLWAFGIVRERTADVSAPSPGLEAEVALNDSQDGAARVEQDDERSENASEAAPEAMSLFVRTHGEEPVFVYEVVRQDDAPMPVRHGRNQTLADMHMLLDDIEAVRKRYLIDGTEAAPLGPVLAEIKGKCVVGPLTLRRDEYGKWRATPQIVAVRSPFPPQSFHTLDMEGGKRKVRLATEALPDLVSEVDFRSDQEAIEGVLDELLNAVPSLAHNDVVQEALHRLIVQAPSLRLASTQPAEAYQRRRLEMALERIQDDDELKKRWRSAILDAPEVKSIVEVARREAAESAIQEAGDALQELQKQLDEQRALLSTAELELREREKRLAELKLQTLQAGTELMEVTDARIASIASKVVMEVADRIVTKLPAPQIMVADIPHLPDDEVACPQREPIVPEIVQQVPKNALSSSVLTAWKNAQGEEEASSCAEALTRLQRRLGSTGFPDKLAVPLLAAWLADLIPVIIGVDSLRLLRCAAQCFAANRFLIAPVTADITSAADLFGRVQATHRTYAPAASGIADILLAVAQGDLSDRFGIVAFAGVNLTDTIGVFLPLIEAYRNAWRGGYEAAMPIVHPATFDVNDPYEPLCRAVWPVNLLPAFTLAEGASPLPPPPAFWQTAVLITAPPAEDKAPSKQYFDIRSATWEAGRQAARSHTPTANSNSNDNALDRRFVGALLACGVEKAEAHRLTFLSRRLPILLSSGREALEDDIPQGTDKDAISQIRNTLLYGGA